MSALLIKWLVGAALVLGLVAAAQTAYVHWRNTQQDIGAEKQKDVDQRAADKLKREAAVELAAALARAAKQERELQALKDAQDVNDANNQKTVNRLSANLRALRNSAGQLRDPYAAPASGCGRGSGGAPTAVAATPGPSGDNTTQAPGLLSPELTEFLQRKDAEADEINNAYISCRAGSLGLRAAQQH